MIDRNQVEKILKINGVPTNAPDEVIRSVLLSARFKKDEVDSALLVLRENTTTHENRIDGLHKIFRTTTGLQPHEIAQLLSIDIDVTDALSSREKKKEMSFAYELIIIALAVLVAITAVLSYMYVNDFGVFHQNAAYALNKQ